MSDYPTLDAMDRPWYEPDLYSGPVNNVPPALAYDGGQVGALTLRAGSVAAEKRRPQHSGHDAFAVWTDPHGSMCLMAVADGLGESDSAGQAARAATSLAIQACRTRSAENPTGLGSVLRALAGDVDRTLSARTPKQDPGYLTTLVLALLPTAVPPGGQVPAAVARVGDSTAWRIRSGSFEPIFDLGEPGPFGGFAAPTHVLPGHGHTLDVRTMQLCDGEVLALTTDGLARDVRGERATGFLEPLWAAPPTPLEFLASLSVRRNDRDDDRAAAVVWLGHYESRRAGGW